MRRMRRAERKTSDDTSFPKYSIAVAADLSGVPQQQLRRMEDSGLVLPRRTQGNTRRYSDADMDQIASVAELGEAGINAAGIHYILALRAELAALVAENAYLRAENGALRRNDSVPPTTTAGPAEESARDRTQKQKPVDRQQTKA